MIKRARQKPQSGDAAHDARQDRRRRVVSSPLPASGPLRAMGETPKLNLFTLVAIRWIAIVGQALTITIAIALGFKLPASWCIVVVISSALLNLWLMSTPRLRGGRSGAWIGEVAALGVLSFDLIQLAVLLMLTGGIINPFAILMLAPVTVSAATLHRSATVIISLLAMVWAVAISFIALPLPYQTAPLIVPMYFRLGLMLALILGIAFVAFYLSNIAEQARNLASALSSVNLALEREQRLSAIGGLAANAAHELGTPLGTIAIVAKELWKEAPEGSHLKEDAALLVEESNRCRAILTEISRSKKMDDGDSYNLLPISSLVDLSIERHQGDYDLPIETIIHTPKGLKESDQPLVQRKPELIQGLGNIIQNALQHAQSAVWIHIGWDEENFSITVEDDGAGFDPDLLDRLGDPYLKAEDRRKRGKAASGGSSMGIGVFIATTLLNRSGATVAFSNRPHQGASVELRFRREM